MLKRGWKIPPLLCPGLIVEKILYYCSRRGGIVGRLEHLGGETGRSWSGIVCRG